MLGPGIIRGYPIWNIHTVSVPFDAVVDDCLWTVCGAICVDQFVPVLHELLIASTRCAERDHLDSNALRKVV